MAYEIIIVGAGISGATLAERFATQLNKKVLIIEKRDHVGGNCYDHYDQAGVLVHRYGAHLFHTNFEDVWSYVNNFSKWIPYEHHVLSYVDDKLVPIPVNITTINTLFGLNLNKRTVGKWLKENQIYYENPQNSEEVSLTRVGKVLYEKMFKNYTIKQWDQHPKELAPEVMARIPIRFNYDDRYFSDTYQYMPEKGYTKTFEKMLDHPNIEIELNTDYRERKKSLGKYEKLFYTGPIDQYFDYQYKDMGKLQYRSLKFEFESFNKEFYQENSVINYPSLEYDFTRIVEFKHFTGQKINKTTISREYPTWEGEPYYPVPNEENRKIYELYQKEAQKLESENIYMVGRLANYKYFNMDQAFRNALDLFERVKDERK